jgi:hypothetical protein
MIIMNDEFERVCNCLVITVDGEVYFDTPLKIVGTPLGHAERISVS